MLSFSIIFIWTYLTHFTQSQKQTSCVAAKSMHKCVTVNNVSIMLSPLFMIAVCVCTCWIYEEGLYRKAINIIVICASAAGWQQSRRVRCFFHFEALIYSFSSGRNVLIPTGFHKKQQESSAKNKKNISVGTKWFCLCQHGLRSPRNSRVIASCSE